LRSDCRRCSRQRIGAQHECNRDDANSGGTTVTVAPIDDSTISKASATSSTNYGTATTLTVDGDGRMNDFLLNCAVPAGCSPTAANLTLTVGSRSTANKVHGGDFYATLTPSWAEANVTVASAPSPSGSPVSFERRCN